MYNQRRSLGIKLSFLLAGVACLAGCDSAGHFTFLGYTTQPTFDAGIRTVYVPMPGNTTYLKDFEFELQRQVINQLGTSPYRVASDRGRADTELLMKIVAVQKTVLLQNQLGENRAAQETFTIEVVWRDLRPGRGGDILSNPKRFDPNVPLLPGETPPTAPAAVPLKVMPMGQWIPELGGSTMTAEQQAAMKAAMQIVNMMEVWR